MSVGIVASAVAQQEAGSESGEKTESQKTESLRPHLRFGLEARANFRNSEDNRFQVPFDFDPEPGPDHVVRGF